MKFKKKCSNCKNGIPIGVNQDILCRIHGAVAPDYVCSKHSYVAVNNYYKAMDYKCADCEYFKLKSVNSSENVSIGVCEMFSVRQYDGSVKKACSKYSKKRVRGAS